MRKPKRTVQCYRLVALRDKAGRTREVVMRHLGRSIIEPVWDGRRGFGQREYWPEPGRTVSGLIVFREGQS